MLTPFVLERLCRRNSHALNFGTMVLLLCANYAAGQTQTVQDLDISAPRPLNEALFTIQQTLRIPINFEEAPPISKSELVSGSVYGLRADKFYQKGGRLVVHFLPNESNVLSATQTSLAAYATSGLPAKYAIDQQGEMITVLPIISTPISNARITIPDAERSTEELVQLITDRAARASGKTVKLMRQPYRDATPFRFSADNESFISVFQRLTVTLGPTSFRIIFDVPSQTYYLTLDSVAPLPVEVPLAGQAQQHGRANSPFFTKDKQ